MEQIIVTVQNRWNEDIKILLSTPTYHDHEGNQTLLTSHEIPDGVLGYNIRQVRLRKQRNKSIIDLE